MRLRRKDRGTLHRINCHSHRANKFNCSHGCNVLIDCNWRAHADTHARVQSKHIDYFHSTRWWSTQRRLRQKKRPLTLAHPSLVHMHAFICLTVHSNKQCFMLSHSLNWFNDTLSGARHSNVTLMSWYVTLMNHLILHRFKLLDSSNQLSLDALTIIYLFSSTFFSTTSSFSSFFSCSLFSCIICNQQTAKQTV